MAGWVACFLLFLIFGVLSQILKAMKNQEIRIYRLDADTGETKKIYQGPHVGPKSIQ